MLSSFEKGIIELIKCSLNDTEPTLSEDFDFDTAYEFAQKMQITPLLFYGASKIPGFMDSMVGKKFLQSTMRMNFYCTKQNEKINGVLSQFKKEKIEHLRLKGTILRGLYPYPEMRVMGDADILIKYDDYKRIAPIMTECSFTQVCESNHELIWEYKSVIIELHKRLIPSYNKDYYEYFGDGWKLATKKDEETNEYFMTDEDCFIYLFVHFAKHYRDAGIGVKHLTDFYVYMKAHTNLDFDYIESEFEKLQILEFWHNIKRVLDFWFYDGAEDELTEFITKKIFASEAYGTGEAHIQSEAVKMSKSGGDVKKRKFIRLMFPPYSGMCQKYPFLKKAPILLPFMWIWRLIVAIFYPEKIRVQKEKLDRISEDSIQKYQDELNYVGLDFNFKE